MSSRPESGPSVWGRLRPLVVALPFGWLLFFFALPFVILLRISITDMGEQLDPFASLLRTVNGQLGFFVQVQSFISLLRSPEDGWFDTLYLDSYALSLRYALSTTALCLFVGYPFAYFLARARPAYRALLLLMVMLPFWTSFLLRVYAWKGILADQGVVNRLLMALRLIEEPVQLLYNDFSMLIGMTYVYLPFMVLPLYANLVKADIRLVEAAQDLGASAWRTFWLVTVPLSRSGIVAGSILVFIPCLGEFVIPSLLGGADNIMIGRVVWDEMFSSNNWPRASALSISMIVLVIAPLAWFNQRVARKAAAEQAR
jgi:putrescine transport system permease protein